MSGPWVERSEETRSPAQQRSRCGRRSTRVDFTERAESFGRLFSEITRTWPNRFPSHRRHTRSGRHARHRARSRSQSPRSRQRQSARQIIAACHKRGLLILSAGTYGNVIRLLTPLAASDDQLREGMSILEDAFVEATPVTQ